MDQGDVLLGMDVACDVSAPALVRDALFRLSGIGWVLGDAMLVASELVTNAVRHSGGGENAMIEVRVRRGREALTISVRDPGHSGRRAAVAELDENMIGGLGLRVVDSIALRWGEERDSGYRVWAELAVDEGQVQAEATG